MGEHTPVSREPARGLGDGAQTRPLSNDERELPILRNYFAIVEQRSGRQSYAAEMILEHFNEDGSLKGEGVWRGKSIHEWLMKWIDAQRELDAALPGDFSDEGSLTAANEQIKLRRDAARWRAIRKFLFVDSCGKLCLMLNGIQIRGPGDHAEGAKMEKVLDRAIAEQLI